MMTAARKGITHYVRYTHRGETAYGTRDGDVIHRLAGDFFSDPQLSGETVAVKDVKLEVPVDPSRVGKVIGLTGSGPALLNMRRIRVSSPCSPPRF